MKKSFLVGVLVIAFLMVMAPTAFAENAEPTFTDVPADHIFFSYIEAIAEAKITTGWEEEDGTYTFRPRNLITRMAMAAFLSRALDLEDKHVVPEDPTFADVPKDHPFFDEIELLAASGISTGWEEEDGTYTFRPSANVTRMAMAAFLYRGLDLEDAAEGEPSFIDVDGDHPFFDEIEALAASGITTGYTEEDGEFTYRPRNDITRMAMAAFLARAFDLIPALEVVSVEAINATTTVPVGTSEEDAAEALEDDTLYLLTFDDDSTTTLAGSGWEAVDDYASTTAGTYEFTGQLEPAEDYTWGDDATSTVAGFVVVEDLVLSGEIVYLNYTEDTTTTASSTLAIGIQVEDQFGNYYDDLEEADYDETLIDASSTTFVSFASGGFSVLAGHDGMYLIVVEGGVAPAWDGTEPVDGTPIEVKFDEVKFDDFAIEGEYRAS